MAFRGRPYPDRVICPRFHDLSVSKENGDHSVLENFRNIWSEDEYKGNLCISTRAKDEDGYWHTSIGVIAVDRENGTEIIMSGGHEGDQFKLVIDRSLRRGLAPETKKMVEDGDRLRQIEDEIAALEKERATIRGKQPLEEEKSLASPILMAAGVIGGALLASLTKDCPAARVQRDAVLDAGEVVDDVVQTVLDGR